MMCASNAKLPDFDHDGGKYPLALTLIPNLTFTARLSTHVVCGRSTNNLNYGGTHPNPEPDPHRSS